MRVLVAALILLAAACGSGPINHINTTVRDLRENQVVDGVPCLRNDLPPLHIHVHLELLLDGTPVIVPAGIGVGRPWGISAGFISTGACFAWIHTHDTTGVVHVFTQEGRSFTLGQVFEVWGQPLGRGMALGFSGPLVVLLNGRQFGGDPRSAPLTSFEQIVLELGKAPASPPPPYDFRHMTGQ